MSTTIAQAKQAIYNRLASAPTYHPSSTDLFENFLLRSGDLVTVKIGNDSYSVPVNSLKLTWKGDSRIKVESSGSQKRQPLEKAAQNPLGGGGASGGGSGGSRISGKQQERIEFIVGIDENGDMCIKNPGYIVLAINDAQESVVHINADHINIDSANSFHSLAGSLEYDSNGKLLIHNAGGVYVQRTEGGVTSTFGVWDQGNLTGGVMATQINGQSAVKISGDSIDINGSQIVIDAARIDINGIVTALATRNLGCGQLHVEGRAEFLNDIYGEAAITAEGQIRSNTAIAVGNDAATWRTKTITSYTLSSQGSFISSDGPVIGYIVTGSSSSTIHYLGGADT